MQRKLKIIKNLSKKFQTRSSQIFINAIVLLLLLCIIVTYLFPTVKRIENINFSSSKELFEYLIYTNNAEETLTVISRKISGHVLLERASSHEDLAPDIERFQNIINQITELIIESRGLTVIQHKVLDLKQRVIRYLSQLPLFFKAQEQKISTVDKFDSTFQNLRTSIQDLSQVYEERLENRLGQDPKQNFFSPQDLQTYTIWKNLKNLSYLLENSLAIIWENHSRFYIETFLDVIAQYSEKTNTLIAENSRIISQEEISGLERISRRNRLYIRATNDLFSDFREQLLIFEKLEGIEKEIRQNLHEMGQQVSIITKARSQKSPQLLIHLLLFVTGFALTFMFLISLPTPSENKKSDHDT